MTTQQTIQIDRTPDQWQPPTTLADCRRMLAAYEADLAEVRAVMATMKARAEHRAITDAGGSKALGANAEDRARAILILIDHDAEWAEAVETERAYHRRVLALRAEIQVHEDTRRGDELAARERLISLLDRIDTGRSADDAVLETAAGLIVLPERATWDGGVD